MISWDSFMETSLKLPGIKVNREEYLKDVFKAYGNVSDFSSQSPLSLFDDKIVEKVAKASINGHLISVSGASAAAGIPGGFAMFGTVPADMAQYYYHVIIIAQKLGYLYGWPDLLDDKKQFSESSRNIITLFVGIMMGASAANKAITEIGKNLSVQVAKRIPSQALTKTAYYPIIKQIGKWIGMKVTKETFAKGAAKVVPILGGLLSGGLTYFTFKPMAKKLQAKLKEDAGSYNFYGSEDGKMNFANGNYEDAEYCDSEENNTTNSTLNLDFIKIQVLINIAKIDFELHEKEIEFISEIINDSDLNDDEKMNLLNQLHTKDIAQVDLTQLKKDELYALTLIEALSSLVKVDEIIKPMEKIYFYKIVRELGYTREDVADMFDGRSDATVVSENLSI